VSVIHFLKETFKEHETKDAMVWRAQTYSYRWILERIEFWREKIHSWAIHPGRVIFFKADFSPDSVSLFLALTERRCILVPMTDAAESEQAERMSVSQAETLIALGPEGVYAAHALPNHAEAGLYERLRKEDHPGLVLFSSGSSGTPKAVVHDLNALLEKFKVKRPCRRTLLFLLFDHIGGLNTMFHTLSNGGCLVTVEDRSPYGVLDLIEKYSVEVLPATPTFLNMILLSGAYENRDLSCLKLVTYGTEPMSESTLKKFHEAFPGTELLQTYGLSELGILRSKSKSSDSLWVKVGGEGFETRVVDGILQIRAQSAMLGYLNAPNPFTEDGWFITNDAVETDGEYLRILGRKSDWINVGGQKVNPVEVESVIREMPEVADVTVYAGRNYLLGHYVCAKILAKTHVEDPGIFIKSLKRFCAGRLEAYKVPVKVEFAKEETGITARFKKARSAHA